MARNEEKQLGRLNRLYLKNLKEEEEKRNPKRPRLMQIASAEEIKQWLPSIKKDIDFCLKQSQVPCYPESKIKEFHQKIDHLQGEYKAFVRKLKQLDPTIKETPWRDRKYKKINVTSSLIYKRQDFVPETKLMNQPTNTGVVNNNYTNPQCDEDSSIPRILCDRDNTTKDIYCDTDSTSKDPCCNNDNISIDPQSISGSCSSDLPFKTGIETEVPTKCTRKTLTIDNHKHVSPKKNSHQKNEEHSESTCFVPIATPILDDDFKYRSLYGYETSNICNDSNEGISDLQDKPLVFSGNRNDLHTNFKGNNSLQSLLPYSDSDED